jgi:hypothetical protein
MCRFAKYIRFVASPARLRASWGESNDHCGLKQIDFIDVCHQKPQVDVNVRAALR